MKKKGISATQPYEPGSPELNFDHLEAEYRLIRAALVDAGVNMNDSIDALYRDWLRWREKPKSRAAVDRNAVAEADQWWARHLAQFRSLIDPLHIAARAIRARKDESAVAGESISSEEATS